MRLKAFRLSRSFRNSRSLGPQNKFRDDSRLLCEDVQQVFTLQPGIVPTQEFISSASTPCKYHEGEAVEVKEVTV